MSKYNNKKVEVDGIKFPSQLEASYYKYLLEQKKKGIVKSFDMQVPFVLLEPYELLGRKVRGISYVADFVVNYKDGREEVIDIKGMLLSDAKLKIKMFESRYKKTLHLITYSKLDGGWISLNELAKARKERKKLKEINKSNKI